MAETFKVDWITELPREPTDKECIVLAARKKNGETIIIRYIESDYYEKMRVANKISPSVTDLAFLTDGLDELINKSRGAITHFELGFAEKMPPKEDGEVVSVDGDPFQQ